ncbi:MAG TPA: zinc-binding dehydrogenase [Acidimicrobiales bacterium]|nr:zinc-binding dehydrogenase [Acidimicrobiales bacterium]
MRAVLTREPGRMDTVELPPPALDGEGMVLLRPEAVGLCGSDVHLLHGDLGAKPSGDGLYPRIQGHELSCVVEAFAGTGDGLAVGERVAVMPILACGECYPCLTGRPNVCSRLQVLGVHVDGGLADRLAVARGQVFPTGDLSAELTAFVEPVSVAVHAVRRGRVAAGEHVVVYGAGPIGQAVCLAAAAAGALVAVVEPLANRRTIGPAAGADLVVDPFASPAAALLKEWAGGSGPEVVLDTTAVPGAFRQALDVVTHGGRVVVVGLTDREVSFPVGLPAHKELDILGTSCCDADDFAAAIRLVSGAREALAPLITRQFPLERTAEALAFVAEHPEQSMKVLVRIDGPAAS